MRPALGVPPSLTSPALTSQALTSRRPPAASVILAWLAVGLLTMATPAAAVAEIILVQPGGDSRVEGSFEIVVQVRPDDGEVIERVESRVSGAGNRTTALVADGDPDADGTQVWRADVDPAAGLALPNGVYRIGVRVSPLVGQPAEEAGHDVRLAVPPPRRELTAEPSEDDATTVQLTWEPVALPDFLGYRIQRRPDADTGTWTTVQDLTDPRAQQVSDQVAQAGAYRYRLIVVRSDGEDGELFTTSAPQGVRADPADPGTFPAPPEPDPRPTPSPAPAPSPTPSDTGPAPPPADPQPDQADPPVAPVTVPQPSGGSSAPPTSPPAVIPFEDGVFEELLPFEETESEIVIRETETTFREGARREGGTLAVLTEQPRDRGFLTATAAGLLLIVMSAHVRRFLSAGRSR